MQMINPVSTPAKVLIVDAMPAVREAMRWRIEDEVDLTVVGEASNGREALVRAVELQPDVVILDINLPDLDSYTVARQLKAMPYPPLVIFLILHRSLLARQPDLEAQGDGFAEKSQGWSSVISQIRSALSARLSGDK